MVGAGNKKHRHLPHLLWTVAISWTTSGAESFEMFVYNSAGGLRGQAANVIGTDSDSAVIRGDGDYYLVINTAQPYQIAVEEIN